MSSSNRSGKWLIFVVVWLVILGGGVFAYRTIFPGKDGPGPGPIPRGAVLQVPFILWGGDVATFHANGGLETQAGTLFQKHGLKVKLTRGDDFNQQVKDYLENKSPFLRGTMSMLGQAAEKIAKDDKTMPVVFLQLTWSAGDHLIARSGIKTLADLRGKKIALQEDGPHVGMLQDILTTARLSWSKNAKGEVEGDIQVVWTKDVIGPNGPTELFRKNPSVDACFALTPDMEEMTGGLDKVGLRNKGLQIEGAHVLVSTAHMSRSIADVYACRKDFFDKNREVVEKFAAAYLKASEELVEMKKKGLADFKAVLKLTQEFYGKDDIKDESAAQGLIDDATFVGLPGNRNFFDQKGNLSGFKAKLTAAQNVALALGDAKRRYDFRTAGFDYNKIKELGELTAQSGSKERFPKELNFLQDDTIYSFNISFKTNQSTFPADEYGGDFQRALEQASLFGNAAMVLRGHTDAISVLTRFAAAGEAKKMLVPKGPLLKLPVDNSKDITIHGRYELSGGPVLDLEDPKTSKQIVELIKKDNFGDTDLNKQVKKMLELSQNRADAARQAIVDYAENLTYRLDVSQVRAVGVGMEEPIVPIPVAMEDRPKNRRVEFRIVRVKLGDLKTADFDD